MFEAIDFRVIGECIANPQHLLLLGDDGQCYAFDLASGEVARLEPEPDAAWAPDVSATEMREQEVLAERLLP